jgi:LacI family transcriptional regulator
MAANRMADHRTSAERSRASRLATASLATLSEQLLLSKATISRVLTRAPAAKAIPQATQDRIFLAAKRMNYRPNLLARSLRRGHSMTIGVLVPELSEGYATLVLAGLEETLSSAGYALMLITHHQRQEVLDDSQRVFLERAVDGIVAVDTALPTLGPLPTVTVSCPGWHGSVANITLDHDLAADLALTHLYHLGHREIAIIKGQTFSSDTEPRWQSIQNAALRLGLTLKPELVVQLEKNLATDEPGFVAGERLIASSIPFTALFAFNDISAIGAIRYFRQAGMDVPGDISVVGFDDVNLAAYHQPTLTTIRQPLHEMGCHAAEAVLRAIAVETSEGPPTCEIRSSREVVKPALVIRNSTATARPRLYSI